MASVAKKEKVKVSLSTMTETTDNQTLVKINRTKIFEGNAKFYPNITIGILYNEVFNVDYPD